MNKKLWVALLVLAIMLGPVSGFWSKPAMANTQERRLLCAAWPWHDDFYQSGNPSPPDTSALNNTGNRVRMQNAQRSYYSEH